MSNTANTNQEQLLGQFIPLHYHYQMLLDQTRMEGFKRALEYAVPPHGKVVELGGGTGVLSYFAAQRASRVWCVERNPQMVAAARKYLKLNNVDQKVEVVDGDALEFCPPEEVDVVVCEMLHSALLREKQIQVIDAFKKNYRAKFPNAKLPRFIPEATILAVQPVHQDYNFSGYEAPVPISFEPHYTDTGTLGLTDPLVYAMIEYRNDLPSSLRYETNVAIATPGLLNAVRFVTKNLLAIILEQNTSIDWHNFYLVMPLETPFTVRPGQRISLSLSYSPGSPLESLSLACLPAS